MATRSPETASPPTFYRRPLPEPLIPFASLEGRRLFREALDGGGMEGWFALAEQFHTQSEPAFCGLSTLVVALNALEIDPGRIWKGPWRWYAEELLDCCLPLDEVRVRGLTLDEVACLARCNGATASVAHADETTPEALRAAVRRAVTAPRGPVLIAAYARAELGQTGEGHFSPIAGYHAARDLALVLDVARFKYPPHWVPLELLWRSMGPVDPASGRPRGWVVLDRSATPLALLFRLTVDGGGAGFGPALLESAPARLAATGATRAEAFVDALDGALDESSAWITRATEGPGLLPPEHQALVEALLAELRATAAFALVRRTRGQREPRLLRDEALAMLVLALPDEILADYPSAAVSALAAHRLPVTPALANEVAALREQLLTLRLWHARGSAAGCVSPCHGR